MHSLEHRPWGSFINLADTPSYKVKILDIFPHQKLSLQKHLHRSEVWTVVEGDGFYVNSAMQHGDKLHKLEKGQVVEIPPEAVHRLIGGPKGLRIVEVQMAYGESGKCVEDDIIRIEDEFGRV